MQTYIDEITKDFYILRIDDKETKFFEALWNIPEGITYNSYLYKSDDGSILFDTWKGNYSDKFISVLQKITDIEDIKYLVIHHMEPDHSGSIKKLLHYTDNIKILGHPLSKLMLQSFYGISQNFYPVKDNQVLEIGDEKIRFIHTPWLHWPETMMSFLEKRKILVSCDAFGSFSIPNSLYDDIELNGYMKYVKKYFTTVIGHYTSFVSKNIEKITTKNGIMPEIIAPAHGLVFKKYPAKIIEYYYSLSKGIEKNKVTVIYDSMYGSIEKTISKVLDILYEKKIDFSVYKFTDIKQDDMGEALSDVIDSKIVILGVSTYENDLFPTMKYFLDIMSSKINFRKKLLVFISYGWSNIASKKLIEKLGKKYNIIKIIEIKGSPKEKEISETKNTLLEYI